MMNGINTGAWPIVVRQMRNYTRFALPRLDAAGLAPYLWRPDYFHNINARDRLMLRKLSLAVAVSCASNAMAWAAEAPLSTKTDLVSVYQEAVDNNADLAAARAQYGAQKEVVPQARAGLLPNLSGGAEVANVRTSIDQPSATANRSAHSYQATLAQPLFRADRWFQYQAAKDVNEQAALELS